MRYFHKKEHKHWIMDYGFQEETETVVGLPCQYETCICSKSSLYYIWVGVDFDNLLVHLYIEYECGGEVSRDTISLEDIDVNNENAFMQALADMITTFVEESF